MSKTGFVYKLCCNDIEIKECYVGSTNNERVRKSDHKKRCINPNQKTHNCYVYQYIRENGGFQNWDMVRLEEFKYDDKRELHTRERYWLETLKVKETDYELYPNIKGAARSASVVDSTAV